MRILGGFAKGGGGGRLKTMVCVNILSRFMMNNTSKLGRVTTWTIFLEGTRIAQGKNRYLTDGFDTWCFSLKEGPMQIWLLPEFQSRVAKWHENAKQKAYNYLIQEIFASPGGK